MTDTGVSGLARRPEAETGPSGPETSARVREGRSERWNRWIWRTAGYLAFVAIWQFASTYLVADFILPPPLDILQTVADIVRSGDLVRNFGATLQTIAIGFGIAFLVGSAIGIAMGRSVWWEKFLGDAVTATLTTPGIVFALVSAMIFGLSALGPIVAVVVTSFSWVAVNVVEGVKAAPQEEIDMARSFRVPSWRVLRHLLLPSIVPFLFTAARYGFSVSWKIATLAEIIVGTKGIGFMMRREFQQFSMSGFLSWVLLFFIFALFLERMLQWQTERVMRWRPEIAR